MNSIKNNKEKHYENASGLNSNNIYTSFYDEKGVIWIGTKDAGVFKLENGKFINYTEKDGLASNWISSIARDNNNNMYFGTIGEGLSCYNGKKFINVFITEDMVGHRLGEFSSSRTFKGHGRIVKRVIEKT